MEAVMNTGLTEDMEAALRAAIHAGALVNCQDISPERIAKGAMPDRCAIADGITALINSGNARYTRGHLFIRLVINEVTKPIIMEELQALMQRATDIRTQLIDMRQIATDVITFCNPDAPQQDETKRSNEQLIKVIEALLRGNGIGFAGHPEVADIIKELGCNAGPGLGANSYYASLPQPLNDSWIWFHPEDIDNLEAMTCFTRR